MDVIANQGFYDLCVSVDQNDISELKQTLLRLYKLGYGTIAINSTYDETILGNDKKKKKKKGENGENAQDILPEPMNIENLKNEFKNKLHLLTRLTFSCSDPGKTYTLAHCTNIKKYDLYAIAPKTQNALQFACSQLSADIITLAPTVVGLRMNRKLYQQAVERGLHFEIQYADVLNPDTRRIAIYHSHLFYTYGKSKGVFISSGAANATMLRNPYDIVNLYPFIHFSTYNNLYKNVKCIFFIS